MEYHLSNLDNEVQFKLDVTNFSIFFLKRRVSKSLRHHPIGPIYSKDNFNQTHLNTIQL